MNSTSLFKLGGVALAAWASLAQAGLDSRSFGVVAVLLILMALLDAGQPVARSHESGQAPADSQAFSRRFFSLACAPFYLVLIILTFVSTQGRESAGGVDPLLRAQAMAAGGMCGGGCGTGGGCGSGGCGASKGGGCGCSSKGQAKPAAAQAPAPARTLTREELQQRAEMVQKRSMSAAPAAPSLPGLNGRPLPAGLTPKSGVTLPAGVEASPASPAAPAAATPTTTPAPSKAGSADPS